MSLLEPLIKRADTGFDGAMEDMPTGPEQAIRRGIEIFFSSFGSHPATVRAGTEAIRTVPEFRERWGRPDAQVDWADAALITSERDRGAAPDTVPALDLATSLNLMNERTMMATLAGEQGAVDHRDVVDTLAHIWLTSIYGTSQ